MTAMKKNPRCLYENSFVDFINDTEMSILGVLCDHFHGVVLTTQMEAWKAEIEIMQGIISGLDN